MVGLAVQKSTPDGTSTLDGRNSAPVDSIGSFS